MDYRRLVYFLFTNFITFSTLIMVVLLIILQKKTRESEVTEKTEPRDLRPDQMRKVSSSLSDIGLIAGLSVLTVLFLSYFTIPVLRDIPYRSRWLQSNQKRIIPFVDALCYNALNNGICVPFHRELNSPVSIHTKG